MSHCPVCGGEEDIVSHTCRINPFKGKTMRGHQCQSCGLIRYPENLGGFSKKVSKETLEGNLRSLRNATDERPGREFFMAEMGMEIVSKHDASVSFFGSGLNTDHLWLKRKYPDITTKLVDLENMQEAENFEPISDATPSDVVVASEVIEHFTEPVEHFKSLLRLVKDEGILICSSNIYDGTDIGLHQYPFVAGHVAYWTPLALIKLASDMGCFVDFRTPAVGLTRGGPRKKYIIFYKSTQNMFRTSLYFGTHMHAPSEA